MLARMQVFESILDVVGDTPLVRLGRLGRGLAPQLLAKVEYLNPGGSVKDRIGLAMVERAERAGLLKPGGTIVEPTSGNTGAGLAIVAALKGYRCVFVMPDKMSQEKIALLRGYGAEVVIAPTAVPPDSPESYYSVADRLTAEIPGAFQPNQYRNEANPEGSIYTSQDVHPYLVEGVGEDFWPETFDRSVVDRYVTVSDRDAFLMTRRLAREEGLLVGGSCGLATVAAVEVAKEHGRDTTIVVLLPDSGRGYLSKIYNDDWMRDHGFLPRRGAATVVDVLGGKAHHDTPSLVTVASHERVKEAIDRLHAYSVSQLPVVHG